MKEIRYQAFEACKELTDVVIPDGVTKVGSRAFYDCDGLTSVAVPEGVARIESFAFDFCDNLTSATIPGTVWEVGERAFADCPKLKSVTIKEGVACSLGRNVFLGCPALESVTIPKSVTSIADNAMDKGVTIYGPSGSYAETWARNHGNKFVAVKAPQPTKPTQPTKPAKVRLVSVKNIAPRTAAVKWKMVSDASGYEVCRATRRDGKYQKVATVKSGKTVTYKNSKHTKGKTYYYKVRAYKTVGKKPIYGMFSTVKGVTIRSNSSDSPMFFRCLTGSISELLQASGH